MHFPVLASNVESGVHERHLLAVASNSKPLKQAEHLGEFVLSKSQQVAHGNGHGRHNQETESYHVPEGQREFKHLFPASEKL